MIHSFKHPIIGQEAICGDGLGRVEAFRDAFPDQWVQVRTYIDNRSCKWSPDNVELVPIFKTRPPLGLTNEQIAWLEQRAAQQGGTVSGLIHDAVAAWIAADGGGAAGGAGGGGGGR